jgi:response regulator RpfG family c-di-GMP phosphodiesterase
MPAPDTQDSLTYRGGEVIPDSSAPGVPEDLEKWHALVVTDRPEICTLLGDALWRHGCGVSTSASGREAIERLAEADPDLMLLDFHLREVSAIKVITQALESDPALGVVVLLNEADGVRAAVCLERGAMDHLTGPFDAAALDRDLGRALRWWSRLAGQQRRLGRVKKAVISRTDELKEARENREKCTLAALHALVSVQEAKNPFFAGHSLRVASVSAAVAVQIGLPADEVQLVRHGGRLHDLGMIGVREKVWDTPGTLTEEQYQQVKQHPVIGARILEPATQLGAIVNYVHRHHERWDGTGYPDGLGGDDIPLGSRIIHAAEVFDALTTRRPYQELLSAEDALTRMRDLAGQALDAGVVEAFGETIAAHRSLPFGRDDVIWSAPYRAQGGEHPPDGGAAA